MRGAFQFRPLAGGVEPADFRQPVGKFVEKIADHVHDGGAFQFVAKLFEPRGIEMFRRGVAGAAGGTAASSA